MVLHPTRHITGHLRDEPFQAINGTGTDERKHRQINSCTKTQKKTNAKNLP